MSSFFAFLDDIAVIAKMAAATMDDVAVGATKAAAKSAGILVDDAAVTPKYLAEVSPKRELPVVWAIAKKSIFNKLVIVLPVIMVLMWLAPWVLPFILIVGGCYLIFEGTEKVLHWILKKESHDKDSEKDEKKVIAGAARTDLVLSFEIMLISLASVDATDWVTRALVLVVVALLMTAVVYGAVALLIKIDDIGIYFARHAKTHLGRGAGVRIARSMPAVFKVITVIGVIAMLWVGGHILIVSLNDVGVPFIYDWLHGVTDAVAPAGGFVVWFVDAFISAIVGIIVGVILVPIIETIVKLAKKDKRHNAHGGDAQAEAYKKVAEQLVELEETTDKESVLAQMKEIDELRNSEGFIEKDVDEVK